MEIKIYIDILFFTNFYFDCILLFLTCLLLRQKPKPPRLFLAASFGGIYSVLLFFYAGSPIFSLAGKAIAGLLMLLICSPAHCLRAFLKHLAVFFSLSFAAGGLANFLLFQTPFGAQLGAAQAGGIWYMNLPFFSVPFLLFLGYLLIRKTVTFGSLLGGETLYHLEIHYRGNAITAIGFYDSGNMMKSDNGRGVMVTDIATISPLLGGKTLDALPCNIPCRTLWGSGHLPAFLPDAIYIKKGLTKRQILPFYVAVSSNPIPHHWNVILPRDFKETMNYEAPVFTKNV